MSTRSLSTTESRSKYRRPDRQRAQPPTPAAETLLEILGDSYTRRVLQSIIDEPRTCREIIDDADVSKATAYRRLETLKEAGLVESSIKLDLGGNHCEQFQAVIDRVQFQFGEDGFDANVTLEHAGETDDR